MPGKKDPEYFPLNLNMSGIGSFYGDDDLSPLNGSPSHHGKFEYGSGSPPLNMSFNVSIPPANSEEDDTDDESSSVAGSDIDVDMDSLVYSIREKLKMSPKFSANPSDSYWAESPSNEPNGCAVVKPSGVVVANSGSVVSCSNNNNVHSNNNNISNNSRRFRNHHHPYSQWRHSIHHSNHHHHHHSNNHSNYHHRQIINGGIQKQHHKSTYGHWWSSKSFNDISRVSSKNGSADGPPTDPYSLLQELIESGSLIKEAVRRMNLKQKRFTSLSNANANNSSSLTKKFSYRDEDSENSYPPMPMSAP